MRSSLRRPYFWAVLGAGAAAPAIWSLAWRGAGTAPPWLALVLFGMGAAAMHFQLNLGPRLKVNVDTAVHFAALLVYGPVEGTLIVVASKLIGGVSLMVRSGNVPGRRMQTLRAAAFNSAVMSIAVSLAGAVYFSVTPHLVPATLVRMQDVWAVPAAAATMYLANSWLVSVMVSLQLGKRPLDVWLAGQRLAALQFAGLFLVGVVMAATAVGHPWLTAVLALPALIIYVSIKRGVQLAEQTVAAVEAMADIVDRRDRYTFDHSRRVAEYSTLIGRSLGLRGQDLETLRLAARVHDLGKVGVPDSVLSKPTRLDPGEEALMRAHVEVGYEILSRFPEYQVGRDLILAHHERYDGGGYPKKVTGRTLPVLAQVLPVADALDAMTSDRPYRSAMSLDQALRVLEHGRGTQWNPEVVDALLRAMGAPRSSPAEARVGRTVTV